MFGASDDGRLCQDRGPRQIGLPNDRGPGRSKYVGVADQPVCAIGTAVTAKADAYTHDAERLELVAS